MQDHDVFKDCYINLKGGWLNGTNLSAGRLGRADLNGAHLKGADLQKVYLQGASLTGAQLHRANLYLACLQEAGLVNAHLEMATLEAAKLQCAILAGARLRGADLSFAALHGAILTDAAAGGAHLQGAILRNTELHEANLGGVKMQGVGSEPVPGDSFRERMWSSIDRGSNFTCTIFSGGLCSEQDVNSRVKGLSYDGAQYLRERLCQHIGKPRSHELPQDSSAVIGACTKEQVEKWIDNYEKQMMDGDIYYLKRIIRRQTEASDAPSRENDK